jgi:hypothetical protein
MKISNTMKIKQSDGSFEDVKISYIRPNGCTEEGYNTTASGSNSHAEGMSTTASGLGSHAEGKMTTASGSNSHAEGYNTIASKNFSHAEGSWTIAAGNNQHVQGRYNVEDTEGKYAHIVGNGEEGAPSNAHTLDWDGNAWFAGDVKDGKGNVLDNAQKQADKAYALAEKKVSGISNSIITGSQRYEGTAISEQYSFIDPNAIGKTFIICSTQDSGNPILRASLESSTGEITVYFSGTVTLMRVNYICF